MSEPTGFLYPFIEAEERDPAALLVALSASAAEKAHISRRLADATLLATHHLIEAAATAMAERFRQGGRLFCCGNGGSATDAAAIASLFCGPPAIGASLSARSLSADPAIITALANDVGFELVFTRQLIAHGRPADIVLALSTSGDSPNLVHALRHARRAGMLTVGIAGYDGGAMAASGVVDHLIVVGSDSVHRIQETQSAVSYALWAAVHRALTDGGPHG